MPGIDAAVAPRELYVAALAAADAFGAAGSGTDDLDLLSLQELTGECGNVGTFSAIEEAGRAGSVQNDGFIVGKAYEPG